MTEWKTYKIGDIIDEIAMGPFGSNIKVDNFIDFGVPVLNGANLQGFKLKEESFNYVSSQKADSLGKANAYRGDIVITHRGTLGQIVYIPNDSKFDRYIISQSQFRVRLNSQYVLPEYFVYYFHTRIGQHKMLMNASQVGVPALARPTSTFKEITIELPPLEEQRRIAGILGAIDDKIENNRRINTNLELQAQALFDEWLCKVNTIKGTFNDIIDATLVGDWGQETLQGNYTHEVYCIRGADIPALRNGDKGKMPIRYILERNYLVKHLRANDIVVEISGGSPTQSTGRVCMITKSLLDRLGKDVVCTNFCRAITPKNGYAIFIFLYWQMLYNKNTMFSYENGTTGIKNLNIADLISKEPINVPKQEDVDKLNVVLQPIYDQIYANGLQNETLATLRDTLLPKLMNEEIKL